MRARGREGDSHADHCTICARLISDLVDASVRILLAAEVMEELGQAACCSAGVSCWQILLQKSL